MNADTIAALSAAPAGVIQDQPTLKETSSDRKTALKIQTDHGHQCSQPVERLPSIFSTEPKQFAACRYAKLAHSCDTRTRRRRIISVRSRNGGDLYALSVALVRGSHPVCRCVS